MTTPVRMNRVQDKGLHASVRRHSGRVLDNGLLDPTLISSLFIRAGILHPASNMLFLMAFGDNVGTSKHKLIVFSVSAA